MKNKNVHLKKCTPSSPAISKLILLALLVLPNCRCFAQYHSSLLAWGENSSGETNVPPSAANAVAVAGRDYQSLALRSDGTLVQWGAPAAIPSAATNIVAIAAGGMHSLALRADGGVVAWGTDFYGETKVPASATNVVAISASFSSSLALRIDGSIIIWGDYHLTNVISIASNVVGVAAGHAENYAMRSDGSVVTWPNCGCVLGQYVSATNMVTITAGLQNLGIRTNGSVVAWQAASYSEQAVPAAASNAVAVAAGDYHRLVLRGDGSIVAWGDNTWGQCNVPPAATNAVAIGAGWKHSLVVLGDSPWVASTRLTNSFFSGQSAVLVANAVGASPLTYRWFRNGLPVATTMWPKLVLANTHPADSGLYTVVVSNVLGSVTGQVASLTFVDRPPVTLGSVALQPASQGGGLNFQVSGLSGSGPVVVFASTNLLSWKPVFTNPPLVGFLQYTDAIPVTNVSRFFRVAEPRP